MCLKKGKNLILIVFIQDKEKLQSELHVMKDAFSLTKTRFSAQDDDNRSLKIESGRLKEVSFVFRSLCTKMCCTDYCSRLLNAMCSFLGSRIFRVCVLICVYSL